ncbi:hypothetical protein HYH03_004244 [Edaphochlamys debaryana]|uniref:Uncharacterized protein n=1 Tax=Edaphochlamys debaryana TaxID=47281 RepID=A0A835Y817_9CHLO|nr:hypothetical protein HYH03_004244 [Edaphochlamys debaryana]|eukprot:KAG2497985.1 hypothetical protein HYH03_004244 [Edaphochlamys debaryana]
MGVASGQQPLRRGGEGLDQSLGRDALSRTGGLRQTPGPHYSGAGPPVSTFGARPSSRPVSSAYNMNSPRGHAGNSYRDAALVAAQHGLGAYAPSAAAAAAAAASNATRNLPSRGGGGGLHTTYGGHPPPYQYQPHFQPHHSQRLPSRQGPPASRSGMPPSRSGIPPSRSGPPPSRGGPPPPTSPGAYNRRSSDSAGHGDAPWRGSHDSSHDGPGPAQPSGFTAAMAGGGGGGGAVRSLASAVVPGWGAGAAASYEADGRPGTRGGGPQYDMEGRPTTRGGQRPPSRAQLGLGPKPSPHVAPLAAGTWANMFGGGSPGSALSGSGSASSPTGTLSGTNGSGELSGSLRRPSLLPMPPSMAPGSGATPSLPSLNGHAGSGGGGPGGHFAERSDRGGGMGGTGRLASKLASIAEAPSPPMVSPKGPSPGAGGAGRKGPGRERDGALGAVPNGGMDAFLDGISEEDAADGASLNDLDSCLSNLDQDGSTRGSGRARPRRSATASSGGSGANSRQHSSHGGAQVEEPPARTAR